ncbi:hypothetical protein EKO25_20690 [Bacillus sp. SAJ1]|nr:hypothetical protein EKO25_20690 [Bacillus sp. SAJ1]
MSLKPRSQQDQGLALPRKAIMPTTPCKVATTNQLAILCTFILQYTSVLILKKLSATFQDIVIYIKDHTSY